VTKMSIVALGVDRSIEALKILGVKVYLLSKGIEEQEKAEAIDLILKSRVVIIEEEIYNVISNMLEQILSGVKRPPLLIVVPSLRNRKTTRIQELYELVSKAVGVELKWKK